MIAESIDWKAQCGHFCYLRQSHTSILGMREFVPGKRVHAVEADILKSAKEDRVTPITKDTLNFNVFVFPVQCNFSGERFPLSWIDHVKQGCLSDLVGNSYPWIVVLDAASYLTTTPLNLCDFPADFVVFSFYKLFGFPTSIGTLEIIAIDHGYDFIERIETP
jgi:molybdenum cofactor sulfurtransferase